MRSLALCLPAPQLQPGPSRRDLPLGCKLALRTPWVSATFCWQQQKMLHQSDQLCCQAMLGVRTSAPAAPASTSVAAARQHVLRARTSPGFQLAPQACLTSFWLVRAACLHEHDCATCRPAAHRSVALLGALPGALSRPWWGEHLPARAAAAAAAVLCASAAHAACQGLRCPSARHDSSKSGQPAGALLSTLQQAHR